MRSKEDILKCLSIACTYAEELDMDAGDSGEFIVALDKKISDLFDKLGNRMAISPEKIGVSDTCLGLIKKNVRTDAVLKMLMEQMTEYSSFNFEKRAIVSDDEEIIIQSLTGAVNMMGEELHEKVEELKLKNEELEALSRMLDEKNQYLNSVTKAIDESALVSITDLAGNITRVNKSFCETSQYSETELLGQNHRIVNSSYHSTEFWEDMWNAILAGNTWRNDVKNRAKDGSEYWVDTVINPIKDVNGETTHFLSIRNLITKRKQQENELIKNDKIIREALSEKEMLLKEIHHRVKNNLQIIGGLIVMQAKRSNSAEVVEQLNESHRRIKAIALMHEKLYQSNTIATVNIVDYTNSIINLVSGIYNGKHHVEFHHEISEEITFSIDRALPYGLLLNEIISNSNKHAFTGMESGKIFVSLHKKNTSLMLTVRDNGKGMDMSIGLNQRKSLGMKLIHSLSLQLKANTSYKNDNGVLVEVEIIDALK